MPPEPTAAQGPLPRSQSLHPPEQPSYRKPFHPTAIYKRKLTNPIQKAFPLPDSSASSPVWLLTYLSSDPPARHTAIGTTTALPPTPRSFRENERFLPILNKVLARHAHEDEGLKGQAKAYASPGGAGLGVVGSGGGGAS